MRLVIYSGLTYAEVPGYRPLLLDLHVPDDAAAAPVVVWIHGGGFVSGDRRYLPATMAPDSIFAALTGAGLACATVDYRLAAEAGWPAQRNDIAAAISFLRARAGEYGLASGRLATWGESAGGHLALMAGLTDSQVAAVVAWYPLTDLTLLPPGAFSGMAAKTPASSLSAPFDNWARVSVISSSSKSSKNILTRHCDSRVKPGGSNPGERQAPANSWIASSFNSSQ